MESQVRVLRRPRILRRLRRPKAVSEARTGPRKGFYLFPNLVTSTSLLLGFYAITESFKGDFYKACWAVFFAMFFDGLDGKIARLTKTNSAFGGQYDSLSDLVSFGVAPGLIILNYALAYSFRPRVGWTIAFLYVVCGALRLARYNVRPTSTKMYFEGMPIPAGAACLILAVIFTRHVGFLTDAGHSSIPNFFLVYTLVVALLMVSTLPYYGFKDIDMFRRHKFGTLVIFVVMLVVVFQEPEVTLFMGMMAYALSGIVLGYLQRKKKDEPSIEAPAS